MPFAISNCEGCAQVNTKYFCARHVPYSLKEKIEHELKKLVILDIYQPVASSQWAAPTVSVLICSDYKQTVNKTANCEKYPVPKIQQYFCNIQWGRNSQKKT